MEEPQKVKIDAASDAEVKVVLQSSDEGTCYYRKFLVVEDIIVGEIVNSGYERMRYSEIVNSKLH